MITGFPNARIAASIVWIPILDKDSLEAALPTVAFLNDKRFRHYYDPDQIIGKEIADRIGWEGHVAWDIYLFFKPHAYWNEIPPKPIYWMHQLPDRWADREHYRTGDGLVNELSVTMKRLL